MPGPFRSFLDLHVAGAGRGSLLNSAVRDAIMT
jgi:hypothetical protein